MADPEDSIDEPAVALAKFQGLIPETSRLFGKARSSPDSPRHNKDRSQPLKEADTVNPES